MSYETVSVRMSRNDPSIRWGFGFVQRGDKVYIGNVEKDSLGDRAGVKANDTVDAICGRNTRGISASEVQHIADTQRCEVFLNLQRYVTSHDCLPWTLTEKDNKLVVDEVGPGFGTGFAHKGFNDMKSSNLGRGASVGANSALTSNSFNENWNRSRSQGQNFAPQVSPSSFTKKEESSTYRRSETGYGNQPPTREEYSTQTASNYDSNNPAKNTSFTTTSQSGGIGSGQFPRIGGLGSNQGSFGATGPATAPKPIGLGSHGTSYGSSKNTSVGGGTNNVNSFARAAPTYASDYSNKNTYAPPFSDSHQPTRYGDSTATHSFKSGGKPVNETMTINTQQPSRTQSSLSPGGSKIFYQSPSSRVRRDLSPGASVVHLQYNSPMNLYSMQTAAEQYSQQTGLPASGSQMGKQPAYVNSATRKLIEEEERGRAQVNAQNSQSSSFKRISGAVGTPVH